MGLSPHEVLPGWPRALGPTNRREETMGVATACSRQPMWAKAYPLLSVRTDLPCRFLHSDVLSGNPNIVAWRPCPMHVSDLASTHTDIPAMSALVEASFRAAASTPDPKSRWRTRLQAIARSSSASANHMPVIWHGGPGLIPIDDLSPVQSGASPESECSTPYGNISRRAPIM